MGRLTLCTKRSGISTYFNYNGVFLKVGLFEGATGDFKHPIWVDIDNDSDADFFATRIGTSPKLWRNGASGLVIQNIGQGAYSCTITDAVGCVDTFTVEVLD